MSFGRVCVRDSVASGYCPAYAAAAAAAAAGLLFSFIFYFISFHFISFYVRLFFFVLSVVVVVVAVWGWCYELFYIYFKYAAYVFSGRRFEYLHAIAMSILRHFHCKMCLCALSKCVCVSHKLLSACFSWCRVF